MVQLSSTFTAFHFARCRVLNVNFARYTPNMYLAFYWLAMANSCVNPLVYYWMNKRYSVHIIIINSLIYYWMKGIKLFILLAGFGSVVVWGLFKFNQEMWSPVSIQSSILSDLYVKDIFWKIYRQLPLSHQKVKKANSCCIYQSNSK